jgi:hypothetical protein
VALSKGVGKYLNRSCYWHQKKQKTKKTKKTKNKNINKKLKNIKKQTNNN